MGAARSLRSPGTTAASGVGFGGYIFRVKGDIDRPLSADGRRAPPDGARRRLEGSLGGDGSLTPEEGQTLRR